MPAEISATITSWVFCGFPPLNETRNFSHEELRKSCDRAGRWTFPHNRVQNIFTLFHTNRVWRCAGDSPCSLLRFIRFIIVKVMIIVVWFIPVLPSPSHLWVLPRLVCQKFVMCQSYCYITHESCPPLAGLSPIQKLLDGACSDWMGPGVSPSLFYATGCLVD